MRRAARAVSKFATFAILATPQTGNAGNATIDYAALEELFGEPVTASATGSPQRESDVAATMIIVTAEDIRRSGARNLSGVLRHVAGLDVLYTSNDHTDVAVRGYNQAFSSRLLVLVDGRQVYADYYGFTPWSTVPVELAAIRQIEIVKGPNSALFGFNAVGGVVNIVTYDPVHDDVDSFSAAVGTQALKQASLVSSWHLGESAGVRLSAGYRDNDDFSSPLQPADVGVRRGNGRASLNLNAVVEVTDTVRLGLEATYSDVTQAEFSPIYQMSYADYSTNSIRGHVSADTRIGLLQASIYTNEIETDTFSGSSAETFIEVDNRVTIAQLQSLSRVATGHTLRLMAEYRNNSMNTTPVGGAEISYDVVAAGGMWEWQIDPSLTLTLAARADRWSLDRSGSTPPGYGLANEDWDRSETTPSFNTSLVWQATETDTLRFLAGRGAQLPNLLAFGGLVLPIPPIGYASGVPDIDPIAVDNYEVSWDRDLSRVPAELRLSVFYGRSHDVVTISGGARPADSVFGTPVNVGDSHTVGVEISLEGVVREMWRWGFSYKYQDVDDRFDPLYPVEVTFTDFEDTTPRHVARANLGWQSGPWTADAYVRFQDRTEAILSDPGFVSTLVPVSSYASIDSRLAYRIDERLTLAVVAQNLAHSEQQQTSAPAVERVVFATVTLNFGDAE
jgi:iron complex outermembrane receptor protein